MNLTFMILPFFSELNINILHVLYLIQNDITINRSKMSKFSLLIIGYEKNYWISQIQTINQGQHNG